MAAGVCSEGKGRRTEKQLGMERRREEDEEEKKRRGAGHRTRSNGGRRDVNKKEGEEHDSAFTVGGPLITPDSECLGKYCHLGHGA